MPRKRREEEEAPPPTPAELFGQRVRAARMRLGAALVPPRDIRQVELARALGVAENAVSIWEAGQREPDIETMQRLAAILMVPAGWLVFGEGSPVIAGVAGDVPSPTELPSIDPTAVSTRVTGERSPRHRLAKGGPRRSA